MVTKMTAENAAKYSVLFNKANTLLGYTPESEEYIQALDKYYSKMKTLVTAAQNDTNEKDPLVFARLPLDEDFFDINANTRQIIIPSSFRSGIAVQGDNLAEVVYFRIDRFFDAIDLATTNIVIQWVNAANEQGISVAYDTSVLTEEEKIIFGWPISQAIAKQSGTLRFSVRFYQTKDPADASQITYNFNTLPASISINDSLDLDLNAIEKENLSDVLTGRIANSTITGIIIPDIPKAGYIDTDGFFHFVENTANILPEEIENGSTLKVMGISTDAGFLQYHWYYQSYDEGSRPTFVQPETDFSLFEKCQDNYHYSEYLVYYIETAGSNGEEGKVKTPEGEFVTKKFALANNITNNSTFEANKGGLYIKYNAYTPNKGAGIYKVSIINTIYNQTANILSNECKIQKPTPIIIKNDSDKPVYFEIYEPDRSTEGGSAAWIGHPQDTELDNFVTIEVDRAGVSMHDTDTFQWYKQDASGSGILIDDATNASYEIQTEGIYYCTITRTRNAISISKNSYKIKAVFRPLPIGYIGSAEFFDANMLDKPTYKNPGYIFTNEHIDASGQSTFNKTIGLTMKIRPKELSMGRELIKTITYQWYIVNGVNESKLGSEGKVTSWDNTSVPNDVTTTITLPANAVTTDGTFVKCRFTLKKGTINDPENKQEGFSTFTITTKSLIATS